MPMLRFEQRTHWGQLDTYCWHGQTLYIFHGSILAARMRARRWPLTRGPHVAQIGPGSFFCLVWGEYPYLFPGSLTGALERGKGYLRHMAQRRRVAQMREERDRYYARLEVAGFAAMFGRQIEEE